MHLTNKGALLALIACTVVYGQGPTIGSCPILPADNIWNTPVDKLPASPNTASYINSMGSTLPLRPDFGSGMYNGAPFGMPFVKVKSTQTKYPATFVYQEESDPGPYAVPLDVSLEGGADQHAIALDMDNCILYEIFAAIPQTNSWYGGGGAIFDLKSNALRPYGWTSADAAGLPIMPGLLRYDEIVAGEVRHALRVSALYTQRAFVWPARHWASYYDDPQHPPLGTRLRLRAGFDVSRYPREIQIIMNGLKKYGMMIADNGASWFFGGEPDPRWDNDMLRLLLDVKGSDFEVVDVSSLMIDPNSGQAKQEGSPAVVITPSSATLTTQATRQFSANQSVSWSVNGVSGGNSQVGYVDAKGLYAAPGSVPNPSTVQLKATSMNGGAATASITIRYPPPVISSVSPPTISTGNFTLTVNGAGFQTGSVVRINGNSVPATFNSSNRLTASGSIATAGSAIPVTVVNPDGQVSGATNIAVTAPSSPPVAVWITPSSVNMRVGLNVQFQATVLNTTNQFVTWKVNGVVGGNETVGTITQSGIYTAPAVIPAMPLSVNATSAADPTRTTSSLVRLFQ
jgi:IPT/TIG domain